MKPLRLTAIQHNPVPMYGDSVVMPPKDNTWIDRRHDYLAAGHYPTTSLNARPHGMPYDPPDLVSEGFAGGGLNQMDFICCLLVLNAVLLLLIALK